MSNERHPWVRAANPPCPSIAELAKRIHARIDGKRPSETVLANYISQQRIEWFARREAFMKALTDVTTLSRSELLRSASDAWSFAPLPVSSFDALDEDPAQILATDPRSWLDAGVVVATVPHGHGRSLFAYLVRRQQRAEVVSVSQVSELVPDRSRQSALVLIDRVDLAEDGPLLARLARKQHSLLILSREVVNADAASAPVNVRNWDLVADWRPRLVEYLCRRLTIEPKKRDRVAANATAILKKTAESFASPAEVVELIQLLCSNTARWSSILLPEDGSASEQDPLSEILRARGVTGTRARALVGVARRAIERRAERVDLALDGSLAREQWASLGIDETDALVEAGLLRRRGERVLVFPEFVARNEARRHLRDVVVSGGSWGHASLEPARRNEIDRILDTLTENELERVVDAAIGIDGQSLEGVARAESIFATLGRRMLAGSAMKLKKRVFREVFERATTAWHHHYPRDGVITPCTRPGFYGGTEARARFIAECWAWSFHAPPIEHVAELAGHFPGWSKAPAAAAWWSQIDVAGERTPNSVSAALHAFAALIARRLPDSAINEKLPPILLAPFVDRMTPDSEAARLLVAFRWPAMRAAQNAPERVWRIVLHREGVQVGFPLLGDLDAPMISPEDAKKIVDELPSNKIEVTDIEGLLPRLRAPILWRWSKDRNRLHRVCAALEKIATRGALTESEVDLIVHLGSTEAAAFGEAATRALWLADADRALKILDSAAKKQGGADDKTMELYVFASPLSERSRVLDVIARHPRRSLEHWLRRSILAQPATSERAWELLAQLP